MSNGMKYASWIASAVAIVIIAMAIPGKFTGMATPVFETLGVEPWGRYLTGILEVVAVLGLLGGFVNRRAAAVGGLVGAVVMAGAVFAHLGPLGVSGDAQQMFIMAIVAFFCSAFVAFANRDALMGASAGMATATE